MIPPKLAAFASRIGLAGVAIAILVALLAVQTVRLEGMRIWPVNIEGAGPKAARLQRDLDNVKAAQEVALDRALEARHRAETKYMNLSEKVQLDAQNSLAGAMADAERYITSHRVRCEAVGGSGSGTVAASDNRDTRVPESLSSSALVGISEADVRACTGAASYAVSAHEWALGLEAGGD